MDAVDVLFALGGFYGLVVLVLWAGAYGANREQDRVTRSYDSFRHRRNEAVCDVAEMQISGDDWTTRVLAGRNQP